MGASMLCSQNEVVSMNNPSSNNIPEDVSESHKRNLWLSANNLLTAEALAAATIQEKSYLSQFPSQALSHVGSTADKKSSSLSSSSYSSTSSCRYPAEKLDYFSKYAAAAAAASSETTSSTSVRQSSSASSLLSSSSSSQYSINELQQQHSLLSSSTAAANNLYAGHFSPVGFPHLPIPQYETAAATSAARTCALPSPTIYPPTPPPSAPWIHPWFIGDTF